MKRWVKSDIMNAANTPDHGDVLVDKHGNGWVARLGSFGYTLRDCENNAHPEMRDAQWFDLVRWWNREHIADVRAAVMESADLCAVGCGWCNHTDTLEAFTRRPVSGSLPPDTFQCPACGRAFRRETLTDRYGDKRVALVETGGAL